MLEEQIKARMEEMIARHGEMVCKSYAAKSTLHCCVQKVNAMLTDGRLEYPCGGTMVDMYSIARYICQPKAEDFKARTKRYKEKTGCKWKI